MPQPAHQADNVVFENLKPSQHVSYSELINGLQKKQKRIDPKYFYDTHGSELFEKITELPEYYPTRTERKILIDNAEEIARYCGDNVTIIEPGSGSSEKIRLLLNAIKPTRYIPIDIAADFLRRSALKLGKEFPWLNVKAICADFSDPNLNKSYLNQGKKIIFYPGSTLGNMEPETAQQFLAYFRSSLNQGDGILIGIDLHKSSSILNAAYNDTQGVTADFNLNALNNINNLVNANFNTDHFNHLAFYNAQEQRIEMHLESNRDHIVRIDDTTVAIKKSERIHTENSYKYTLQGFENLSKEAGLKMRQSWVDDDSLFSVHYLELA